MSGPVLHVTFGHSAAASVHQAARLAKRKDDGVTFTDDLSFGPIDPPDPAERLAWAKRELGLLQDRRQDRRLTADTEKFWTTTLSTSARRWIWVSRHSPANHAGFLECLWRLGETSFDVVDLTDVIANIGELPPDRFHQDDLWTRARELPEALHRRYLNKWRRLRSDNAPFRVVRNLELVSAPITVHDDVLLSFAGRDWRTSARVIGNAMGSGVMVGDAVLFGLLRRLVGEGRLEARGDFSTMRSSQVRLPR
jgi:hypothetical protein